MKTICHTLLTTLFIGVLAATAQIPAREICIRPQPDFASNIDWDSILPPMDANYTPISRYPRIAVSDNGHIFLLNREERTIIHFNREGSYLGKFGGAGKSPKLFNHSPEAITTAGNTIVVTDYVRGELVLFSNMGRFIKRIALGYPISDVIGLDANTVAVMGLILVKNGPNRDHIAYVNLETQKEKKIHTYIQQPYESNVEKTAIKTSKGTFYMTTPQSLNRYSQIIKSVAGGIICGNSGITSFQEYDRSGRHLATYTPPIPAIPVTQIDKSDYNKSLNNIISKLDLSKADAKLLREYKFITDSMPYYYHITLLPDNGLLAFYNHDGNERLANAFTLDSGSESVEKINLTIEGFDRPVLSRRNTLLAVSGKDIIVLASKTIDDKIHFQLIKCRID
ncbi:hypothetical protein KAR48_13845 [bacterium]|nr:hypothetical protein [bacterium]